MKAIVMDKQPTAAELFRVELECTKTEVLDVVAISEDTLNQLFFEGAYAWLRHQGCDAAMQTNFTTCPEFWGFWKKTWYDADREFLRHYYYWGYDVAHAHDWYEWFHHADSNLINRDRVNAAYHSLIKILAVKR